MNLVFINLQLSNQVNSITLNANVFHSIISDGLFNSQYSGVTSVTDHISFSLVLNCTNSIKESKCVPFGSTTHAALVSIIFY